MWNIYMPTPHFAISLELVVNVNTTCDITFNFQTSVIIYILIMTQHDTFDSTYIGLNFK